MGGWKPALKWDSKTVIEKVVSEARGAGCRVIVLGGYNFERLGRILQWISNPTMRDVSEENRTVSVLLRAANWKLGMDATIRSGLGELCGSKFFIVPGDMPLIRSDDYVKLAAFENGPIVRPVFEGRPGHPVLLNRCMAEVIRRAAAGTPIRSLIARYRTLLIPWEHEGVVRDLDTRDEYERFNPEISPV